MKNAFRQPSSVPKAPASSRPTAQSPPPSGAMVIAVRYCTTEAATAKEMSMPPAISTTSRPTPKMMLTELALMRSNRFGRVRKVEVVSARPAPIKRMTAINQRSVPPRSRMHRLLDGVDGDGLRLILADEAAVAHVQHDV